MKRTIVPVIAALAIVCACDPEPQEIPVDFVSINRSTLDMTEGETETLTATIKPDNATDKTVVWTSSNTSVAEVSDGRVTAVAPGSADITARAGVKSATCNVTVMARIIPVSSVTLDKTELSMTEDDVAVLTATVKPDDATDKTVTWTSSDTKIVTVSAGGEVKAVAQGKATVTAKAGEKTASCEVTVNAKVIAVASVTLDRTTLELEVKDGVGSSAKLTATVKPDDATDKTVTWTSSDTKIATVSADGEVKAVAQGKSTVTAKAGDKTAVCEVTVTKIVSVTSVTLDRTTLELEVKDGVGSSAKLTATVKPDDATDKTVKWTSSDPKIATVSANGEVKAVAQGKATVTAKAGDKTAVCVVTVGQVVSVTSMTINYSKMTLDKGDAGTLKVTVKPDNATFEAVTWTSSSPGVATVKPIGDGKTNSLTATVTAISGGSSTIKAAAGGKEVSCKVTVNVPVTSISWNGTPPSTVHIGETVTFKVTVNPADATDKTVSWTAGTGVDLKPSADGLSATVKGVLDCSTVITAKAGNKSVSTNVRVSSGVSSVVITNKSLTDDTYIENKALHLTKGETYQLTASVQGESYSDKTVTWSSDNPSYASVSSTGKVTANSPRISGNTVQYIRITAKSKESNISDQIYVYVYSAPTDVKIENLDDFKVFTPGISKTLKCSVSPPTARQRVNVSFNAYSGATQGKYCNYWTIDRVSRLEHKITSPVYQGTMNQQNFFCDAYWIAITTVPTKFSTYYIDLRMNQWSKSDVKPMDYVYYNKNTGKLRSSDGGLRTMLHTATGFYILKESVAPDSQSGESIVGIVTYVGEINDSAANTYKALTGLTNSSGTHGFAVALENAKLGSSSKFKWSGDNDDVDASNNWKCPYKTHIEDKNAEWRNAFSFTLWAGYYNDNRGDSHEIKPFNALMQYAEEHPSGTLSISNPAFFGGYNTHWVIPTYGMDRINSYDGNALYSVHKDVWNEFNANLTAAGGTAFANKDRTWSINTSSANAAYEVSTYSDGYYSLSIRAKSANLGLRPFLIF